MHLINRIMFDQHCNLCEARVYCAEMMCTCLDTWIFEYGLSWEQAYPKGRKKQQPSPEPEKYYSPLWFGNKLAAHGMEATPTPSGMNLGIDLAMTNSIAVGKSSGRMSSTSARNTSLKNAASMKQKLKELLHATGVKLMPRT